MDQETAIIFRYTLLTAVSACPGWGHESRERKKAFFVLKDFYDYRCSKNLVNH